MVAAIAAVAVITALVIIAFVVFVRAEVEEVTRTEAHLDDPGTPTVAYAVPDGVDPVDVSTALRQQGFTSMPQHVGDARCLVIECTPGDRERVREVIAGVHVTAYDGTDLATTDVAFEDER